MNWSLAIPSLAEFPSELIVWVLVGLVWAAVQIFAKMNKARNRESEGDARQTNRGLRPSPTTDPVSPNDELRRFLREISGEGSEPEKPPPPSRRQPEPVALRPTPKRFAPQRAVQTASISESRRQGASASPIRRHSHATPPSLPPQTPTSRPELKKRPIGAKAAYRRVAATPKSPRQSGQPVKPGLGNWRAAVLHREIIGPPRALRPYSPSDF